MRNISIACHFWKWFKLHNFEYIQFPAIRTNTGMLYRFNELQVHVRAYCKWLSADLTINKAMTEGQLVITANGCKQGFKKAEILVSRAPEMPNWTFFALRPPQPVESFIEACHNDAGIELDNLWFSPAQNHYCRHTPIVVYADWILPGKEDSVDDFVSQMIENLLGERSATLDITINDIKQRSDAPTGANLYKLEELPSFIGPKKSTIEIGANGKLFGL